MNSNSKFISRCLSLVVLILLIFYMTTSAFAFVPSWKNVSARLERVGNYSKVWYTAQDPRTGAWLPEESWPQSSFYTGYIYGPVFMCKTPPSVPQGMIAWIATTETGSEGKDYCVDATVYFTVYDPVLQRWQTNGSPQYSSSCCMSTLEVCDGIVSWVTREPQYPYPQSSYNVMYVSTYKPGPGTNYWTEFAIGGPLSSSTSYFIDTITRGGVVALVNTLENDIPDSSDSFVWCGRVSYAIYDPLCSWRSGEDRILRGEITDLDASFGTVYWKWGADDCQAGYNDSVWGFETTKPLAYHGAGPIITSAPPACVWFTDASIGAVNYDWDFGDGDTSTEPSPYHYYNQKGVYTVTQTVSGFGPDSTYTSTIYVGNPTFMTAEDVSGNPGDMVYLSAVLKDKDGNGINDKTVSFKVGNDLVGSAKTSWGYVSVPYNIPLSKIPGEYVITATFADDDNYLGCTGKGKLFVRAGTAISVTNVSGYPGQKVVLKATLSSNSTLLSGKTLNFKVGGSSVGSAQTNASGVAQINYTIPLSKPLGVYNIEVTFNGDNLYNPSTGSGTLTVAKAKSTLTLPNFSGAPGDFIQLTATLKDSSGMPLRDKLIYFDSGPTVYGWTNVNGVATTFFQIPSTWVPGSVHDIYVEFDGDDQAEPAYGVAKLTVLSKDRPTITVASATARQGSSVILSAILKSSTGMPLSGKSVSIGVQDLNIRFIGTTDAYGKVARTCYISSNASAGGYTISAGFYGDSQYYDCSGSAILTVTGKKKTNITMPTVSTPYGPRPGISGARGQTLLLFAILRDFQCSRIPNKLITFKYGSTVIGTATTDGYGVAWLDYTVPSTWVVGKKYTITAIFAGDAQYWNSIGFVPLTVTSSPVMINTVVDFLDNSHGVPGETEYLTATLKDINGGHLHDCVLTYELDGVVIGTATVNGYYANLAYSIPADMPYGYYTVRVTFAGYRNYNGSSHEGLLTVSPACKTCPDIIVPDFSGNPGQTITLSATMKNKNGVPLNNKTLDFLVGTTAVGSAVTNGSGYASVSYTIPTALPVGYSTYVAVEFAGDYEYTPNRGASNFYVVAD